jgi:4-amino-4-deoxy-L-arabinose transferase-like glycosyltransferase
LLISLVLMDALVVPDRPPSTLPPRQWPTRFGALAVTLATLGLMVLTEPRLAIVWDEGFTLGREARIRDWFKAVANPQAFVAAWVPPAPASDLVQADGSKPPGRAEVDTRAKLFSPKVIAWFWPFAREEPHGHPPFYAIEGLIGDWLVPSWAVLPRARLGPMLAFSLTGGAIFGFVARRFGVWAGALAAASWAFQPNLFGHGHYATVDALLTSLWVGAILTFAWAVERNGRSPGWGWVILFGVLCGWAADSKLTGWFLPLPFFVWSLLYRDRRGWLTLLVGGLVAVVVLFAFNPCWWVEPVSGVERFFRSNLTRGRTVPIQVEFLGKIYDTPKESLPWYNTLVWTVLVTPMGFLILGLVGAVVGVWRATSELVARPTGRSSSPLPPGPSPGGRGEEERQESPGPFAVLAALHWGFLLALRAMPHTPGHDGVRLFLPAFGVLAVLGGLGAAVVVGQWGRWGKALVVGAIIEGIASVAVMMPVPLSYFSPVVGGLPGAASLGMEPTYFWDGLSDEAIDWLNAKTPPGRSVQFATFPTSWLYLKQTGRLKVPLTPIDREKPKWLVLQNRPGAFRPFERELFDKGQPAFVASKLGVPLVLIYPYPD